MDKWVQDRANEETLEFSNQIPLTTEFQQGAYTVGFLRLNDVAENTIRFMRRTLPNWVRSFQQN